MKVDIAIYDPRRLTDDDFLSSFVARNELFEFLVHQFEGLSRGQVATHRLIIGQRGMGKTTLLRRIAMELNRDGALSERFVALTFREEQYNVQTLTHLWRNCLEALAEWLEERGHTKEAQAIDLRLERKLPGTADDAWEELNLALKETKRRSVLLIDNIDLILGALSESEAWTLRRLMQERDGLVVIGASSAFLEQTTNPKAPFYEFFQVHTLEPLNAIEMQTCLSRLAESRGDGGRRVMATLASQPGRVRVLHTLTGGNPRTLAFIYLLLESEDPGDVQRDLEILLDSVTGLYKARVEELSPQARAVFDAVALNWDPTPVSLVSKITMLEVTSLSPQLNRLVDRGFLEKVELEQPRTGWQVTERFFNIWYLMRNGGRRTRQRLSWLVSFLSSFYSRDELSRMGREVLKRGLKTPQHARHAYALAELLDNPALKHAIMKRATAELLTFDRAEIETIVAFEDLDQEIVARDELKRMVLSARTWNPGEGEAFFRALRLSGKHIDEQYEVIAQLNKLSDPEVRNQTVTLIGGRNAIWKKGLPDEVALSIERAVDAGYLRNFEDTDNAESAALLASDSNLLLWAALTRPSEAFIRRNHEPVLEAINKYDNLVAGIAALQMGRLQQFFPDQWIRAEKNLRKSLKVRATRHLGWNALGDLWQRAGRHDAAEKAYRKAIKIDPNFAQPWVGLGRLLLQSGSDGPDEAENALLESIRLDPTLAGSQVLLGILYRHLSRNEEAEKAFREAVRLDPSNAYSWLALGDLVRHEFRRYDEAEGAYREAIRCEPTIDHSWIQLGNLMHENLGRFDEAEAAYRHAIELDESAAYQRSALAGLLIKLDRLEEAETAYREAILRNPTDSFLLTELGNCLEHQNRSDEAEAAYRQAIELDKSATYQRAALARLLRKLNRLEEAETTYREALLRDPTDSFLRTDWGNFLSHQNRAAEAEEAYRHAIELDQSAAYQRGALALLLQTRNRLEEAEIVYREAILRDPSDGFLLTELGKLLEDHFGRFSEAEAVYREAIRHDPTDDYALSSLGDLLALRLDRFEEAEQVYREVIRIDPKSVDGWMQLADLLQDRLGRYDEAEQAYREALQIDPLDPSTWDCLGNLLQDHLGRNQEAREAHLKSLEYEKSEICLANLIWIELDEGNFEAAQELRQGLPNATVDDEDRVDPVGIDLLDAGIALITGDPKAAIAFLDKALRHDNPSATSPYYFDDLLRLLRLFAKHGVDEKLLTQLDAMGWSSRFAPVRAGFLAYVFGERTLLDVNPEVRLPAERLYRWLKGHPERDRVGTVWPGPGKSVLDGADRMTKRARRKTKS
jgi:tetratricopeptide (TPR) repeat protein